MLARGGIGIADRMKHLPMGRPRWSYTPEVAEIPGGVWPLARLAAS